MRKPLLTFILLCWCSCLVFAQKGNDNKPYRDEIDKIMKQKFMEKVNVDESTANNFFTMFKENNKKIRMLNKEKKEILESIEGNPDAADIDSKIDKLLDIETKIIEQKKSFMSELKTILTPQQIAKTIILQRNFEKEFKKQIIKQRKRDKIKDKEDSDNK